MTDEVVKKLSGQESIKTASKFLKGNIAAELADLSKPDVSDETYELMKFHGSYFGFNRDSATERKKKGLDKEYEFMVRTRIPGGRLTADQYLAMDEVAEKTANGTLRITTRQVFQFHVVLKENVKQNIAMINRALLSTQSGCGDVVRNVTCSPAPVKDAKHDRIRADVEKVAAFVRPKTSAYRELWLDEAADEVRQRDTTDPDAYEPLYGATYMPRKFKIGLIVPEDNSIDVFTHDLGIVLLFDGEVFKGYNILIGGGMGMKHEAAVKWEDKKTYPRLADNIAFVGPDDLIPAVEAVVKIQRDFGDRTDRQHARIKYLVQENGIAWIRKTFEEYFAKAGGKVVKDPAPVMKYQIPTHMGWHDQKDGKLYLGVPVASGRIVDYDKPHPSGYNPGNNEHFKHARYRTGLKAVIGKYKMNLVLTPTEEIILCDIDPKDKEVITNELKSYGIPLAEEHTPMQIHYMTCVSLPTCAKALAESERVQFQIADSIQSVMDKNGIGNEKISVRVTGCPNGCARPYVGDVGIVGRMPGHYVLFVGGDFEGTRLNQKIFDKVPQDDIAKALDPMFALFAKERKSGEGFGDFCNRYGIANLAATIRPQLSAFKWAAEAA
ncbi:MAG: NADPH-dependent assimilatory sulfite reductase hemoprotein subunit [Proteobacteria bacterium]|nr:NADPH-dependent assimilatory sulfite reductase hemoprotein subunit [Pseudomonadota bacterium]